jgi:hypothetical protein
MSWTRNATVFTRNLLVYGQPSQAGFTFGGGLLDVGELRFQRTTVDQEEQEVVEEQQTTPVDLLHYFESAPAKLQHRYFTSNMACLIGAHLVVASGTELRCFENPFEEPPLIMGTLPEPILGVCCNRDMSLLAVRFETEIQVMRFGGSGQVTPYAHIGPGMLEHEHACRVADCAFGLRNDELLWTLSCGLCLCTDLRSQQTLLIHKLDTTVVCFRNIGHSRRFVVLTPQGLHHVFCSM